MRVAVLTLTRDRLPYSQHCFQSLRDNAGCEFDWIVGDQASTDGTREWLFEQDDLNVELFDENLGICRGLNRLLLNLGDPAYYDVIVRFDNDCEVLQPGTLREAAEVAFAYDAIVSPHVNLLRQPPPTIGTATADHHVIRETPILGGIFMAIPARLFSQLGYRYDETSPLYTGDEAIVPWWRARGGTAGYLDGWHVNHYERVDEQAVRFPEYQARKQAEIEG